MSRLSPEGLCGPGTEYRDWEERCRLERKELMRLARDAGDPVERRYRKIYRGKKMEVVAC